MEARFERTSPLIILIGNFPVLFHACFLGFVSRWSAPLLLGALLLSGVAAAEQAPDPLNQHYSAAQTFQLGGDFERAQAEYDQVLALALQRMGDLLAAEKNDSEEAVRLLQDAVA